MQTEKFQLFRQRDFGEVISDTFQFVKINFGVLIKAMMIYVVPLVLIGGYLFGRFYATALSGNFAENIAANPSSSFKEFGSLGLGYIGLIIGSLMLSLVVMQLFFAYEKSENGNIELQHISDGVKQTFFRFLIFSILFFVVTILVVSVPIVLLIVTQKWVLIGVGIVALMFLYTYLFISVSVAPVYYMRERIGFLSAMSASIALIKGKWWKTFGVIFVVYMVIYFITIFFAIPFYVVMFLQTLNKINGTQSIMGISMALLTVGGTLASSLLFATLVMHYYSLKEEKEGEDLMQQIENIGIE